MNSRSTITHVMYQLLIKVVNRIRTDIQLEVPDLGLSDKIHWPRIVHSPAQFNGQMDNWACGILLMMAIKPCTLGSDFDDVGDSTKRVGRIAVLKVLLDLP